MDNQLIPEKKRWFEFDLLKAIVILCMFSIHLAETVFSKQWEGFEFCTFSPLTSQIMVMLAIITPFAFMFAMGSTMLSSKNRTPQKWIKRGFMLLCCWLLVNSLRIFSIYTVFFSSNYPLSVNNFLYFISITDILFFAGLFFLFFGFLSACRIPIQIIMGMGVLISIIADFILKVPALDRLPNILDNLTGGIVYLPPISSFPFCSWVIVPILGMLWGKVLRSEISKDKLYNITFWLGALSSLICLKFIWPHIYISSRVMNNNVQEAYAMHSLTVITALCVILLLLSILYKIGNWITSSYFKNEIINLAKNLSVFYIIHWGVVALLLLIIPRPTHAYPVYVCFILAILLIPFCNSFANLFNKLVKKNAK